MWESATASPPTEARSSLPRPRDGPPQAPTGPPAGLSRVARRIEHQLLSRCRFATLRNAIPDITDRMLSDRLHELESEGIVERTVIPDTPVRVEYALTKKGTALAPTIAAISEWANRWVSPAAAPIRERRGDEQPGRRRPRRSHPR